MNEFNLSSINLLTAELIQIEAMKQSDCIDIEVCVDELASWAVAAYGTCAGAVIRRRVAESLLANDPEGARCWRLVAEAADHYIDRRQLH
ncbi:MAG: hypothetical protein KGR48_13145 [Alphaproteobacteria bacterium]|nr:hypothetical protein [Alphaproteobacteria bacterium]